MHEIFGTADAPRIEGPDRVAAERAEQRWNTIAKPIGGLGRLEDALVRIAALTGSDVPFLDKRAVLVFCADNGVVAQGISQSDQSVTRIMANALAQGSASVNRMALVADADVIPIDMGIAAPVDGVRDCAIARGTADMSQGPAMTREQAIAAIRAGIALVEELTGEGYGLIATGELGVGNTTTSAAMASVLLDAPVEDVTGRGSGFTSEGLAHKIQVIKQAIAANEPDAGDPLDILAKLGGFDIAGMVGAFIGGAIYRVPILIDGLISSVAALTAVRMIPACKPAMFASHVSSEPAAAALLEELGLEPLITAAMHLGEGTGAVAAMPLLDMAVAVYNQAAVFDEVEIPAYEVHPA